MNTDITQIKELFEFAKYKREHPVEYRELLDLIKEVIKDLVRLTEEVNNEIREER